MSLDQLPKEIREHILEQMSRKYYPEDYPTSVYVTEITGCIVKSFHDPFEVKGEEDFEKAFHLWKGTVLDKELTPLFPLNQKRVTHRIPGFDGTITGKWDFMMKENGKKIICDLKVKDDLTKVKRYGATADYKRQVKFYMYCESAGFGRLYYLSLGDCIPVDIIPTGEKLLETMADMEERARLLITARREGKPPVWKPPAGEQKYMCGEWCKHYAGCYPAGEVGEAADETPEEKVIPVAPDSVPPTAPPEPGVTGEGDKKKFQF